MPQPSNARRRPPLLPTYDWREVAAIFVGGVAGALGRAGLAQGFAPAPGHWPWPTFGVNVVGAFLLGYFVVRLRERLPVSMYRRPLLGTGFCGAFTTFSTMQVELLRMLDRGHLGLAAGYAAASIASGFVAVTAAAAVVRRVRVIV